MAAWSWRWGLSSLLVVAVALISRRFLSSPDGPPPNQDIDLHLLDRLVGYFSEDYFQARSRFISSAEAIGAELHAYPINSTEGLYVDIALLHGDADRVIVHISGTHGVEGYAGSAIQLAAMSESQWLRSSPKPTIVFVHALNAYGFANNRRNNEDNVDLNRNFLSDNDFESLSARNPNFAGYDDVAFILHPKKSLLTQSLWLNEVNAWLLTLRAIVLFGVHKIKVALVSGNYAYPEGLGYGGKMSTLSNSILREVVQSFARGRHMVLVDVHTGLGPVGVDSLGLNLHRGRSITEEDFPVEISFGRVTGGIHDSISQPNEKSTFAGYALTRGTISGEFCGQVAGKSTPPRETLLCVTQEFGTVGNVEVGMAQVLENNAFVFGDDRLKRWYAGRLRDVFCLPGRNWRFNVVRRGLRVLEDAADYLLAAKAAKSDEQPSI